LPELGHRLGEVLRDLRETLSNARKLNKKRGELNRRILGVTGINNRGEQSMAGRSARPDVKQSESVNARHQGAAEPTLESLQQENESLRRLVVTLSELVLRRATDQR
jgi:hypothetical protein